MTANTLWTPWLMSSIQAGTWHGILGMHGLGPHQTSESKLPHNTSAMEMLEKCGLQIDQPGCSFHLKNILVNHYHIYNVTVLSHYANRFNI